MRIPRIHVAGPLAAHAEAWVTGTALEHIRKVLRLRAGAQLTLFDGRGGEYSGHILEYVKGAARVALAEHSDRERESPLDLELWQGICRGGRMDFVIEKATELGVTRIAPLRTQRTVVRLDAARAEKRRMHWQAVATAACEQCGRNRLPEILAPGEVADALGARDATRTALLLDPDAGTGLRDLDPGTTACTLFVGPEGGLEAAERRAALDAGFTPVHLGPRVLRTDTAALTVLAVLQTLWGDA